MPSADLPLMRVMAVVVTVGLMLVLAGLAANTEQLWTEPPLEELIDLPVQPDGEVLERDDGYEGETDDPVARDTPLPDWVAAAVLVVVAGVLIYLVAQHAPKISRPRLSRHRMARSGDDEPITEAEHDDAVIRVTTDLIDDLSLEGDPRAAIQRAYAAVETGFGSRELARKPAEPPLRYMHRVFGRNLDQSGPLQQLTTLFETARFSSQTITEDMRTQAIEAVAEIREHYRSRRRGRVR